ncbi:hypothetical protein T459_16817 [Capsicum annuum]|uniref:RNase H type-1 domain-containing protein n=1 Tax=Capsicum annuum TaxID=4072 RepID=A0A2G2ZA67_CAPAN|nr:hypothetical protein T459_16817 [Capsicum annuum]
MLVMILEAYKLSIQATMVNWKPLIIGVINCNSDGASRGNPDPSAGAFCNRNSEGEFIYANSFNYGILTSLEAEVCAFKRGLEYCVTLILKKILDGVWEVP